MRTHSPHTPEQRLQNLHQITGPSGGSIDSPSLLSQENPHILSTTFFPKKNSARTHFCCPWCRPAVVPDKHPPPTPKLVTARPILPQLCAQGHRVHRTHTFGLRTHKPEPNCGITYLQVPGLPGGYMLVECPACLHSQNNTPKLGRVISLFHSTHKARGLPCCDRQQGSANFVLF